MEKNLQGWAHIRLLVQGIGRHDKRRDRRKRDGICGNGVAPEILHCSIGSDHIGRRGFQDRVRLDMERGFRVGNGSNNGQRSVCRRSVRVPDLDASLQRGRIEHLAVLKENFDCWADIGSVVCRCGRHKLRWDRICHHGLEGICEGSGVSPHAIRIRIDMSAQIIVGRSIDGDRIRRIENIRIGWGEGNGP